MLGLLLALVGSPGCSDEEDRTEKDVFGVGLVFDLEGQDESPLEGSAFHGLVRARDELAIDFEVVEPTDDSEARIALHLFASGDADLIFGVGSGSAEAMVFVAGEFPEKSFVCIDYTGPDDETLPGNLAGIRFRDEEGSYLIGALAGLLTESGTVGFIGGSETPWVQRFEAGYRSGFNKMHPEGQVLVRYLGATRQGAANPIRAKGLALTLIDRGADVLYHAAGSAGRGVIEGARERETLVIGSLSDQRDLAPDQVVTSMVRRVDQVVYREIDRAMRGDFRSGVQTLGLEENGVEYLVNEENARWIVPELKAKVDALRQEILNGGIEVPIR